MSLSFRCGFHVPKLQSPASTSLSFRSGPKSTSACSSSQPAWPAGQPLRRKPAKTAKAAKHNKKTTKITTRTTKPANLDLQGCGLARLLRNTWMPTYLCSLLSQAGKPAKTAKAAKHSKKTTKITGRTTKPANLGLQGCGPTRCSLEALQGSLELPKCLTFSKAL